MTGPPPSLPPWQADCAGGAPPLALVGATNMPDAIDDALLRAGRLEHALYIGPPRRAAREEILRRRLRRMPLAASVAAESAAALAAMASSAAVAEQEEEDAGEADSGEEGALSAAAPVPTDAQGGAMDAQDAAAVLARELAARTPRFSGADLVALCQRAAMAALQRGAAAAAEAALSVELERSDVEQALGEVGPSLTHEMLSRLRAWARSRGS
jgi:SpoVK/Ycf46/Vps4 family AAA+-type ATPase